MWIGIEFLKEALYGSEIRMKVPRQYIGHDTGHTMSLEDRTNRL